MAKYPVIAPWMALPNRRYLNTKTGETISRTAYDRDYGRLKQQGIRSPQKQAAMSHPDVRRAKPAPGRQSAKTAGALKIRALKPLKSHISRRVNIPFDVFYGGSAAEFREDARRFQPEYDLALYNTEKNSRIASVGLSVDFFNERNGTSRPNTILRSMSANRITEEPDAKWDEVIDTIISQAYIGDHYFSMTFLLVFETKYVEKSKLPKKKLTTRRPKK